MKAEFVSRMRNFLIYVIASFLALILALSTVELATRSVDGLYAMLALVFLASILPVRKIRVWASEVLLISMTNSLFWVLVAATGQTGTMVAGIALYTLIFLSTVFALGG